MGIFGRLETYLYTAIASVVMVWASHNPVWHDPALWLLGVIGHAIGAAGNGKSAVSGSIESVP